MKVKFLSTTHSIGEYLPEGLDVDLHIGMRAEFTFNPMKKETIVDDEGRIIEPGEYYNFELRRGVWRTSQIESIKYDEVGRGYFIITIETRNSTYVFSVGEYTEEKPLTKDEILSAQIALGMHLI